MNPTLRWITFEAIMYASLSINGVSASKFNSLERNRISRLDIS
ncbi:MAG: hypothetical protein ACERKN_12320 [Velocimicrobium sp.]